MNNVALLENACWFLTSRIRPTFHTLAAMDGRSESEHQLLLTVADAIARLPDVDDECSMSAEIDYYWEDKNWVGRFRYVSGELELWSAMAQEEGPSHELCAQWQHAVTKISSAQGLEQHDPGHLWYWSECFALFAKACQSPNEGCHGHMVLIGQGRELKIFTPSSDCTEDDEESE
jgi:hypothetical protein